MTPRRPRGSPAATTRRRRRDADIARTPETTGGAHSDYKVEQMVKAGESAKAVAEASKA